MTDYNQALSFFQALTGEASPNLTWQTFCDPDLPADWIGADGKKIDYLASTWNGPFDDACVRALSEKQKVGAGVFFSVNGSTTGGRRAKDIDQFRTMVVDSDGAPYPEQWPYPPHVIIARDDTHWHAYWFIDGVGVDHESWAFAQYQLALWFGGDLRMINADRVLRVPGFIHQKVISDPHYYNIVHFAPTSQRYNMMQLMSGFMLDGDRAAKLMEWVQARTGQGDVTLASYNDSQINIDKYRDYLLTRAEHGVDGQGRNGIRFKTAAAGRDYGLSPETTISLMLEFWDHGNTPPCGPALIDESVRNAYRYSQNALGTRSLSIWLDQPFTLPPGASIQPVSDIVYEVPVPDKKPRIDPLVGDAICMHGTGFNKNHTNNAQLFIKMFSPNGELFVFNDETFRYNGKVYDKIDAGIMEKMMLEAIEHVMPSSSDLSGAMKMLRVKLAEPVEAMPAWRGQPDRPISGVIAFNNGIVDLEASTFEPHTESLLTSNMLTYEYDPAAQCPTWIKFIDSLWHTDPDLIRCFRQWMGYCMVNDYRHQKIAALIGKPRSGKGTIARIMHAVIGKFNCASPSLANLANAEVLHAMSGKLLATIPDASSVSGPGAAAVMEHLKSISGNDSVTFNRKYLPASTETISARMMLIANEFPHFNDPSGAIVDRILYFPFSTSHAGREDTGLTDRLLAELPGIAVWAIGGLLDLRQSGRFVEAKSTRRIKSQLRRQLSPSLSFFSEALTLREGGFVNDNALYQRYVGWCKSTGTFANNRDSLIRAIESAVDGIHRDHEGGLPGFRGASFVNYNAGSDIPEAGQLS